MSTPDDSIRDDLQRRAEELFHDAVDLPPAQRAEFIDRRCGEDRVLSDSVRRLLDAFEKIDGFLEQTPIE